MENLQMAGNLMNQEIFHLLNNNIMNLSKIYIYLNEFAKMGRKSLITGLLMFAGTNASAQLIVNNNLPYDNPQYLINNVFTGSGVTISNIQYTGSTSSIGFFDGTSSNLGLDSGIVLCTGDIAGLPGPNDVSYATLDPVMCLQSPGFCSCYGDSLLSSLSNGQSSYDAAILEFDFIPTNNIILFSYVFGSEEYPEYVGSFNDVMGMFLFGPNPAGGTYNKENIALIPNTILPVSIDNINDTTNSLYYINNDSSMAPPPAGQTVQLDGFTTPLMAIANVVCGATYTIKIGIADINDCMFDSGLFLKASSFGTPNNASVNITTTFQTAAPDSALIEGCGYADFELIRSGDISDSMLVSVSYTGVASNGIDYDLLPDTIVLPPFVTSYNMQVNPILDTLNESDENLQILFTPVLNDPVDSICFTIPPFTVELLIRDYVPLALTTSSDIYLDCPGDTAFLYALTTGGSGFAVFSWSTGLSVSGDIDSSSFFDTPETTAVYIVTVFDTCSGQTLYDTIIVHVPSFQPLAMTLNDTAVCLGESVIITPLVIGGNGDYSYTWSTGDTAISLYLTPVADSAYSISVTDECNTTINAQSTVGIYPEPSAEFSYTLTQNNEAVFTNSSINGLTYSWDFGDGTTSSLENPTHFYNQTRLHSISLHVYSQYNCVDSVTYTVDIISLQKFYVPNILYLNSMNQDNNRLYVFGEGIETLSFTIFDRWGEIVYETFDASTSLRGDGLCCAYGEGWDGTHMNAGEPLNPAVFAYKLNVTYSNGDEFIESGNITLTK
ncbi:MAG TPA: PKD domain-containing protein [Flavobacteriales bacterium]|nr:PKD domain-containing protein [Flavobacteriales bacterium]